MVTPLFKVPARCPECGTGPRIRLAPVVVESVRQLQPEEAVQTYQCHQAKGRVSCGCVYTITAGDVQRARAA